MADVITIPEELVPAMRHAVLYELTNHDSSLYRLADKWSDYHADDSYAEEFWAAAARTERLLVAGRALGLFDPAEGDVLIDAQDRDLVVQLAKAERGYQKYRLGGEVEQGTDTRSIRTLLDSVDGLEAFASELRVAVEVPA